MDYTYATVIIPAADQSAAQAEFPAYFTTGLSADGTPPATNYVTSGPFENGELDHIANDVTWPRTIYFGSDTQAALDRAGLKIVAEPMPVL